MPGTVLCRKGHVYRLFAFLRSQKVRDPVMGIWSSALQWSCEESSPCSDQQTGDCGAVYLKLVVRAVGRRVSGSVGDRGAWLCEPSQVGRETWAFSTGEWPTTEATDSSCTCIRPKLSQTGRRDLKALLSPFDRSRQFCRSAAPVLPPTYLLVLGGAHAPRTLLTARDGSHADPPYPHQPNTHSILPYPCRCLSDLQRRRSRDENRTDIAFISTNLYWR